MRLKTQIGLLVLATLLSSCGRATSAPENLSTPAQPAGSATSAACDPAQFLMNLKSVVPYTQVSLSHNVVQGVHYLNLWLVDPDLDPLAEGQAIADNQVAGRTVAARMGIALAMANPCVAQTFGRMLIIVVDKDYNTWYSGDIAPKDASVSGEATDAALVTVSKAFVDSYARSQPTQSIGRADPPQGACNWAQARDNLQSKFGPSTATRAFYFVIDKDGANVWAQWEGPDPSKMPDTFVQGTVSVAEQLKCLYPSIDTLWLIYVDPAGKAQLIAAAPGSAVQAADLSGLPGQLQILYPSANPLQP
jgi:hypothetical protein